MHIHAGKTGDGEMKIGKEGETGGRTMAVIHGGKGEEILETRTGWLKSSLQYRFH